MIDGEKHLGESDIDVSLQEKLTAAEGFLSAMAERFGGPDMTGALEVPGVTVLSISVEPDASFRTSSAADGAENRKRRA